MLIVKRATLGILLITLLTLTSGFLVPHAAAQGNACLAADVPGCSYGLPTFQYEMLLGPMAANPVPNVQPVEVDENELGINNTYRVVGGTAPIYDGPDGNPAGAIDPGFYPINVMSRKGDWVQVYAKAWMRASDVTNTASSTFSGVLFNGPLAYPMAWVLVPTRPSAIPGDTADPATPMLERYQRVNIFATVNINDWNWYLVGPGQWIEQRRVARVVPQPRPDGVKGHWIAVDLYDQVLVAYDDDRMIFATLVATGVPKPGFGTNKGLFRIWSRLRQDNMSGDMGGPDAYNLPAVPYVMYYDGSISLHGTYWHDAFGYRHSHGCVNLSITDAHWIYDWTGGFYGDTWVYVYTSRDYVKIMPPAA